MINNQNFIMRTYAYLAATALLVAGILTSCKTTEENYRKAYEVTQAKRYEGLTENEVAALKREEATPQTVYKGDSIPMKWVYVKWVEGGAGNRALRYNVVVASFRQKFNAGSAFSRMRDGGYPDAVMLADRDDRYYVAAVTTTSLDTAVAVLHALEAASPVALRDPYPYILQKP